MEYKLFKTSTVLIFRALFHHRLPLTRLMGCSPHRQHQGPQMVPQQIPVPCFQCHYPGYSLSRLVIALRPVDFQNFSFGIFEYLIND